MEEKDITTQNEQLEDALDIENESDMDDVEKARTSDLRENAIEWYTGQSVITVTLTQRKLINKVMDYAKKYPNEVKVDVINADGTVLAHIPLKYLRIQRPREMSEEDKLKSKLRLEEYRKTKKKD